MLGKTLILGLISAGAAGAIVYYGTAPQGSEASESHPHFAENSEKSSAETSARKSISPKLPTIRKADMDDGRQDLEGELPDDSAKKADSKSVADADEMDGIETEAKDAPKKQTRWLDQYLKKNQGDDANDEDKDIRVELNQDPELAASKQGGADSATNSYTVNEEAAINDIEPESMPTVKESASVTDPRIFRIENGKLVEVGSADPEDNAQMEEAQRTSDMHDAMVADDDKSADRKMGQNETSKSEKPRNYVRSEGDITTMANDSTPLLSTVMSEAAEINKSELRDQAYFEITEYALSEGRFDSARLAHDMIEQDELSYTAKSRIAVAYAQSGKPTKAFKVISEVNEPELRDFMRLQVIEALVAPQRLPEAWQTKSGHGDHHHNGAPHSGAGQ